jgi:formylglycine-generating enzyme required for sulfatase activity
VFGANGYRLPTEVEWVYACRAGTTVAYRFGDEEHFLDRYACRSALGGRGWPANPGIKLPNNWGLFDMYGNVGEWCNDWTGSYEEAQRIIKELSFNGPKRRVMDGSSRFPFDRTGELGFGDRKRFVGFRVARDHP